MATGGPKRSKAFRWVFAMRDTDGDVVKNIAEVAVLISEDGATFAGLTGTPSVSEIQLSGGGSGVYYIIVPASDMDWEYAVLYAIGAGAVPTIAIFHMDDVARKALAFGACKLIFNADDGTLTVYDEDGTTVLNTLTITPNEETNEIILTPS
jgi:hypothetical protein